jgi:hypothetical protein
MECVVFKRRIVLGGIASAAILASGVLTAGTALAAGLPQVPDSVPFNVGTVIPTGPMAQAPGLLGALQAAPGRVTGTGNKVSAPNTGTLPKVKKSKTLLQGASGLTKTAQSGVTGSSPLGGLANGSGPVTANLPVVGSMGQTAGAAGGTLKNAGPQVPLLSSLTGSAPGIAPAAGVLGRS